MLDVLPSTSRRSCWSCRPAARSTASSGTSPRARRTAATSARSRRAPGTAMGIEFVTTGVSLGQGMARCAAPRGESPPGTSASTGTARGGSNCCAGPAASAPPCDGSHGLSTEFDGRFASGTVHYPTVWLGASPGRLAARLGSGSLLPDTSDGLSQRQRVADLAFLVPIEGGDVVIERLAESRTTTVRQCAAVCQDRRI